jgi:hypothetical protein
VQWDGTSGNGSEVSSGVYFYRIEARSLDATTVFAQIKKMLFLK